MRRNSTRNTDVAAAHLAKMHTEGHIKGFLQSADGVTVNTATVANRGEQHVRGERGSSQRPKLDHSQPSARARHIFIFMILRCLFFCCCELCCCELRALAGCTGLQHHQRLRRPLR